MQGRNKRKRINHEAKILICWTLTDHREIDFAVPGRGLLEIDPASVNGGVTLTDRLEDEFRGFLRVFEKGTFVEADILPVFPLFQGALRPCVETVSRRASYTWLADDENASSWD